MIKLFSKKNIYLDYASGTPVSKKVRDTLFDAYKLPYGNPDALHHVGVSAKKKIEEARLKIAKSIGAHSDEIFFTSGGTESDSLAILGSARYAKNDGKGNHVILSAVEHSAVFSLIEVLKSEGFEVDILPADSDGRLLIENFKEMLRPETVLVSVMMANNETGIINPISEIAKIIRQYRKQNSIDSKYPLLHTDAIQAFQTEDLKVDPLGADLITLSAQKIYGPVGIGLLYIKRNTKISPIAFGGGQERGIRPGTPATPLILGFAEAVQETKDLRTKEKIRLGNLREFFIKELKKEIRGVVVTGEGLPTVPQILHVRFPNVESETLLLYLDQAGICVSSKSACDSLSKERSHVVEVLGIPNNFGVIRFSLGRDTKKQNLLFVVKKIKKILPLITS